MGLHVYNTLSRSMEELVPLNDRNINMFVCGQTVYDDAHLGHAKTYIDFDIIVRWLRHSGYTVKYVQNVTDVEDKIINRAKESGQDPKALARRYEERLMEDMAAIGVKRDVDMYPRSHDYIEQMREQIQLLLDKGYAYPVGNDIYYDVSKFKDYTKLSGMSLEDLGRHRIEVLEGKRNPYDFALWKASKAGEPSWSIALDTEGNKLITEGRPGWHIEDTAITSAIFGPQYDIHGGARELIFPHHSNEIAQAEAAFGKVPFVKYWLHSGVLNINDEKMSKSLKNFVTIRAVLTEYPAEALRLMMASTHYRKEMNYAPGLLRESDSKLRGMYVSVSLFYNAVESEEGSERASALESSIGILEEGFAEAMDSDFNTPLALSKLGLALFEIESFAKSGFPISRATKGGILQRVLALAKTIGILEDRYYELPFPQDAQALMKERELARKEGRFGESDSIRQRLRSGFGINCEDSKRGAIYYWEPKIGARTA